MLGIPQKSKGCFTRPFSSRLFQEPCITLPFEYYETPFGNIPVDVSTIKELLDEQCKHGPVFKYMSEEIDEEEHSFEMHAPFIYYKGETAIHGLPKIIPILISGMDGKLQEGIVNSLLPYLDNEENHFIISSDFCHWGSRFGYTKYLSSGETTLDTLSDNITSLGSLHQKGLQIYKSIELLDKIALQIATNGSSAAWSKYIDISGNTICGQKPILIVLKLLEKYNNNSSLRGNTFSGSAILKAIQSKERVKAVFPMHLDMLDYELARRVTSNVLVTNFVSFLSFDYAASE